MRVIFPLPPLLVAAAALGGLFIPFAVGSVPTDSIGIAAATERQFGAHLRLSYQVGDRPTFMLLRAGRRFDVAILLAGRTP